MVKTHILGFGFCVVLAVRVRFGFFNPFKTRLKPVSVLKTRPDTLLYKRGGAGRVFCGGAGRVPAGHGFIATPSYTYHLSIGQNNVISDNLLFNPWASHLWNFPSNQIFYTYDLR
jgi:hypothetical protein